MTQTSTATTARKQLSALLAKTSTAALIISLIEVDNTTKTAPTAESAIVRAYTIEELENRFPIASEAVEMEFEAAEARMVAGEDVADLDQVALLLAAIERHAA